MGNWVGVITNVGATLIAQWTGGAVLNVTSAKAGTGTVATENLRVQTALVEEKQTMTMVTGQTITSGRKIKLQITAPVTGYTLNQIGLFANIDGGSNVLLGLYQNSVGIPIPAYADNPDFVYTFYAVLSTSNTGTMTLSIDTSALVSQSTLEEYTGCAYTPDTVTMAASNWSNNTYSFESTYPSSTYDIEVEIAPTATLAQAKAFAKAMIAGSASTNVVTAIGTVPTVDIPVLVSKRKN